MECLVICVGHCNWLWAGKDWKNVLQTGIRFKGWSRAWFWASRAIAWILPLISILSPNYKSGKLYAIASRGGGFPRPNWWGWWKEGSSFCEWEVGTISNRVMEGDFWRGLRVWVAGFRDRCQHAEDGRGRCKNLCTITGAWMWWADIFGMVELTGCNMVYATTSGQHSLVHCIGCYSDRFCDYRTSMAACSSSKDEVLKKLSSIFLFKT